MNDQNAPAVAPATHILKIFRSQKSEILFRAGDGIAIGQRKNDVVVFGEDPNRKTSRVFVDGEHASSFLRDTVSLLDLRKQGAFSAQTGVLAGTVTLDAPVDGPPVIEERDGESIIQMPADAIELPGGMRSFN